MIAYYIVRGYPVEKLLALEYEEKEFFAVAMLLDVERRNKSM